MGLRTWCIISYPLEKLKGIVGESLNLMENAQAKLKEMGAGEVMNNRREKMKELWSSLNLMKNAQAKLKEMGAGEVMNNLHEKMKELWLMMENFGLGSIRWLNVGFPPETRKQLLQHWLRVSTRFIVIGLALLVLFWFICCCCSCIKGVKMMKAPGRNFRMPRHAFEANPKAYFQALHAGKHFNY